MFPQQLPDPKREDPVPGVAMEPIGCPPVPGCPTGFPAPTTPPAHSPVPDSDSTVPADPEELRGDPASSGGWAAKVLAAAELALALVLFFGSNVLRLLPVGETPWILLLGFLSLRLRRLGWDAVGLARPASWGRTLALAASAAAALQFLGSFVAEPLLPRITDRATDLSIVGPQGRNATAFLGELALLWMLKAFGGEFVYRGYLLNRAADLGGRSSAAWVVSLLGVSVLFGMAQAQPSTAGAVNATLTGLFLGGLYLASGRNLWAPILANGISHTIALVLIFTGAVPGVGR